MKYTFTHIGTLRGSPLNNGNTWTCSDPHGSSLPEEVLGSAEELTVVGRLRVEEDAASEVGKCVGRCERFPNRCISRETSRASYVLPVVD